MLFSVIILKKTYLPQNNTFKITQRYLSLPVVKNYLQHNKTLLASLGALFITLIWSGWIILSRHGVKSSLTPEDITLIRYGTATIFTLPFSLKYKWKEITLWKAVVVALGCGFPYTMFSFYGLLEVKSANAGVIVNGLLPVFGMVFLLLILKEKTTKLKFIAIVIILIANLIMMGNLERLITHWFGFLMLISASLVFSSYMFLGKRWGFTTKDVLAFLPLINTSIFLPWWLIHKSGIPETSFTAIALQASYQGILVSVIALLLTFYAIKHIGAMTLSIYFSFVPVITSILAWALLAENLNVHEIIGISLCSFGLLLYAKPITSP